MENGGCLRLQVEVEVEVDGEVAMMLFRTGHFHSGGQGQSYGGIILVESIEMNQF